MTTITKLFYEAKLWLLGCASHTTYFAFLEIASVTYHGTLIVKRDYDHPKLGAWVCTIYILSKPGKGATSFQEYGDTAQEALDLVKAHMFKWARSLETEAA